MTGIINRWHGDVVVMGDVNEVRFASERHGSTFYDSNAAEFNMFITNSHLINVPLEHSWNNDGVHASNAMILLKNKLKSLKQTLKMWSIQKKSIREHDHRVLQDYLLEIDSRLNKGEGLYDDLPNRAKTFHDIGIIDRKISVDMAQKAKCGGSYEADECKQLSQAEQVCLSGGDIYNDPSLLRFYQNDDTSPWGNSKCKEKGEDGPEWIVRNKFEDELANFMLEKKSGISIRDPPFPAPPRLATNNFTERETEKEELEGVEPNITQEPAPRPSILYPPSKTSNLPFPSRLKKQKNDDEDERLLSIFKQIHINLPFFEAMIHKPKGAEVLKGTHMHKENLRKHLLIVT
ncbi:hypothetical protein Tco_0825363 [Tanacetum coccineum]